MCLLALPLVQPHPTPSLHQCRLSRRVRGLQAVPRAAYSGSVSQWVASAFNATSSPTSAERSRAVSLATSFGSCGPIYEPPNIRRHQDRGSEGFPGLFSRPEDVSLRIVSVGVSRSASHGGAAREAGKGAPEPF
jgi:hypothetical protein